jgi:hypothetical protein
MQRTLGRILIAAAIVVIAIQFVPVERSNPIADPALQVDAPVARLLRHACYDCHSQQTIWPWYSRVAPISWLVAHDVHEARRMLNFSVWQQYPARKKSFVSAEAFEQIEKGEMPPSQYRWIHRDARVPAEALPTLRAWADSLHQADTGPGRP